MIKFNLLKFLRVDLIQEMFNLYREQTGITMAFALQRILQEEDEYSYNDKIQNTISRNNESINQSSNFDSNNYSNMSESRFKNKKRDV